MTDSNPIHFSSPELERSILGAMILHPEVVDIAWDHLNADSFSNPANRIVFEVISEIEKEGKRADSPTLLNALRERNKLKDIGGAVYLMTLMDGACVQAYAEQHAKILSQKQQLRDFISHLEQIRYESKEVTTEEIPEKIEKWQQKVLTVGQMADTPVFGIEEVVGAAYQEIEEIREGKRKLGYSWGLPALDEKVFIRKGGIYCIAGLKKSGKSKFLLFAIYNLLMQKVPVLFFSLEMSKVKIGNWLLALASEINTRQLLTTGLGEERWEKVRGARKWLEKFPLTVVVEPSMTIAKVLSIARRWRMRTGKDGAIALDFLQLMNMEREKGQNEASAIKNVAYGLARIAKSMDVPLLFTAQLRNEAEKHRHPNLSFLEGSGGIAQASEAIIILNNIRRTMHKTKPDRTIEWIVSAQRDGESDIMIPLLAYLEYGSFELESFREGEGEWIG